ncbi:MAG: hypothetical protein J1E60_06750 [Christensenellaceae bacterium]|nr:hypothetical protein [Christensenellaceae bacterium]
METVNKRVKFFSKAFIAEMLRTLAPLGVAFMVLEFLDAGSITAIRSTEVYEAVRSDSGYSGFIVLYFALSAYIAALRLRSKQLSTLYGSSPLAKRTIWGSSLTAALIWGAAIAIVHTAGYLLLWLVAMGSKVSFDTVPPSYYAHFILLIRAMLFGIAAYGAVYLLASVTGGIVSLIVTLAASVLFLGAGKLMLMAWSGTEFTLMELLLPVHPQIRSTLDWAFMALLAVGLLIASYFAFTHSRAETIGEPAGSKTLHVAIGTVVALSICFASSCYEMVTAHPITEIKPFASPLKTVVLPLFNGLIAYVIYMLISKRSFKKGLEMLVYYPITIAVFMVAALISVAMVGANDSIAITAETLDCVLVPDSVSDFAVNYDGGFDGDEEWRMWLARSDSYYYDQMRAESIPGDEQYHELYNPELLDAVIRAYAEGRLYTEIGWGYNNAVPDDYLIADSDPRITVMLKDGRCYTLKFYYSEAGLSLQDAILSDSGYLEKATDIMRFENAHIASPMGLDGVIGGESLAGTLLSELENLSPTERAEVFGLTNRSLDKAAYRFGSVVLASPANRYMQRVYLSSLTPKSSELYMRLCNEIAERGGIFERIENVLNGNAKGCGVSINISGRDGSLFTNRDNGIFYEDTYSLNFTTKEDIAEAQRQVSYLAEVFFSRKPPSESDYVFCITSLSVFGSDDMGFDTVTHFGGSALKIFIGITKEQRDELIELFDLSDAYEPANFEFIIDY